MANNTRDKEMHPADKLNTEASNSGSVDAADRCEKFDLHKAILEHLEEQRRLIGPYVDPFKNPVPRHIDFSGSLSIDEIESGMSSDNLSPTYTIEEDE